MMRRRDWIKSCLAGTGTVGLACWGPDLPTLRAQPESSTTHEPLKIRDVRAILTAPAGIRLVVVKVETSEPGLYGVGCATFTQLRGWCKPPWTST